MHVLFSLVEIEILNIDKKMRSLLTIDPGRGFLGRGASA